MTDFEARLSARECRGGWKADGPLMGRGPLENCQQIGRSDLFVPLYGISRPYVCPVTARCWIIDISKTFSESEQQVIAIVA